MKNFKIPIEVSARHVHLASNDLVGLFGKGYQLTSLKRLSQPGQFACQESIAIVGPRDEIANVRIIGPLRDKTQVEVSLTDCRKLGVQGLIRSSGETQNTPGIILRGPKGEVNLAEGVIVAQRHLHIEPKLASQYNLENGDFISIKTKGLRSVIFNNVVVRSGEGLDYLSFQVDADEANAAGLKNGDEGEII